MDNQIDKLRSEIKDKQNVLLSHLEEKMMKSISWVDILVPTYPNHHILFREYERIKTGQNFHSFQEPQLAEVNNGLTIQLLLSYPDGDEKTYLSDFSILKLLAQKLGIDFNHLKDNIYHSEFGRNCEIYEVNLLKILNKSQLHQFLTKENDQCNQLDLEWYLDEFLEINIQGWSKDKMIQKTVEGLMRENDLKSN